MSAVDQGRARPAAVSLAVKLMYAIAALGVLGLVLALADTSGIRDQLSTASPSLSASALDAAVAAAVVFAVVFGLIGAALWVLLAVFTARGRGWARIVATVLAALVVLSGLGALRGGIALTDVPALLQLVCAVGVLVLLYRRESNAHFAAVKAARSGGPGTPEPGYPSDPGYPPVA